MDGDTLAASRVVVVGSANQDLTTYTPKQPVMGETVLGTGFETSCGGKGANQAVAAAALAPTHMICKVGKDAFAETLLQNFRRVGVEWDNASVYTGVSTGVASIVVETTSGDNCIVVAPGANHALTPEDVRASLLALPQPAVVVTQLEISYESALEAMRVAKQLGATTVLNPAPAPLDSKALDAFYPFVDIIIPNESELRTLCQSSGDDDEVSMAKSLLEKGVAVVVVTLGARGAVVVQKDAVEFVSPPSGLPWEELPVVDTVGAGDCFCGTLSAYLASGAPLAQAAERACGMAGRSVRYRGAQTSYLTSSQVPPSLQINIEKKKKKKPIITLVTGNPNKVKEIQMLLDKEEVPFEIQCRDLDLPEWQGTDAQEIAEKKCRLAAERVGGAVLTEDTSLCMHALGGMPGPYVKWFLERCGPDGLHRMLTGFDDTSAYAQTVLALTMGPDQPIHLFEGRTEGQIVAPRGPSDFGWDPIFAPPGGLTYAEMSQEAKNTVSHRSKAMQKLQDYLQHTLGTDKETL